MKKYWSFKKATILFVTFNDLSFNSFKCSSISSEDKFFCCRIFLVNFENFSLIWLITDRRISLKYFEILLNPSNDEIGKSFIFLLIESKFFRNWFSLIMNSGIFNSSLMDIWEFLLAFWFTLITACEFDNFDIRWLRFKFDWLSVLKGPASIRIT